MNMNSFVLRIKQQFEGILHEQKQILIFKYFPCKQNDPIPPSSQHQPHGTILINFLWF